MKRIAIIGTENSHASAFASLLAENSTVKIIGAFGTDPNANRTFSEKFGIDCSAASAGDFAGLADGVMITSRDGKSHFESALPYMVAGSTVFIDKPITISVHEAKRLADLAALSGAKLCGGSCLKYSAGITGLRKLAEAEPSDICGASFCAPVEMDSPYSGFFFYAQHLVEMCTAVLGENIVSVYAKRTPTKASVLLNYGNFCASLFFGSDIYTATLTLRSHDRHTEIKNVTALYANELSYFVSLLNGGKPKFSPQSVIYPVIILNAISRSFTENKEIIL